MGIGRVIKDARNGSDYTEINLFYTRIRCILHKRCIPQSGLKKCKQSIYVNALNRLTWKSVFQDATEHQFSPNSHSPYLHTTTTGICYITGTRIWQDGRCQPGDKKRNCERREAVKMIDSTPGDGRKALSLFVLNTSRTMAISRKGKMVQLTDLDATLPISTQHLRIVPIS